MDSNKFIYLQQTINNLKYKLSASDEINFNLEKTLESEQQRNKLLKNLNSEFTHRVRAVSIENEQLREANDVLRANNQMLADEIGQLKSESDLMRQDLDARDKRLCQLEVELESKTADCEQYMKELQYQKVNEFKSFVLKRILVSF